MVQAMDQESVEGAMDQGAFKERWIWDNSINTNRDRGIDNNRDHSMVKDKI
jgi:hypothetical protein